MELGAAQTRERSRKRVRLAALTQHAVVSHLRRFSNVAFLRRMISSDYNQL